MDWWTKKVQKELEDIGKRQQRAMGKISIDYHEFLVLLPQNKKLGKLRTGESLSQEARRLGAWTGRESDIYVSLELPYFTVDGKIQMARDQHEEKGYRLDIETSYDPKTQMWRAVVDSEWKGKAKGHAVANIGGGGVDKTNPMENAETSAVGRALSFMGYGLLGTGVASAEEVLAALREQERLQKVEMQELQRPDHTEQADQQQQGTNSSSATPENQGIFTGKVTVQNSQIKPNSKNPNKVAAVVMTVDENGEFKCLYADEPLAQSIRDWELQPGTNLEITAKPVPNRKGDWILLAAKTGFDEQGQRIA